MKKQDGCYLSRLSVKCITAAMLLKQDASSQRVREYFVKCVVTLHEILICAPAHFKKLKRPKNPVADYLNS